MEEKKEKKTTKVKKQLKKEREFVNASTGKKASKPAVVSAKAGKSALTGRIIALVLWLLALTAEIFAVLIVTQRIYLAPGAERNIWTIALLAVDFILVLIGSQLWKNANHKDPVSERNRLKFFLWNQMGLIVAVICFLPFVLFVLFDKNVDKKSKPLLIIAAVAALIIGSLLSVDWHPVSAEDLAAKQQEIVARGGDPDTVYWTRFGKSYHIDPECSAIINSSVIYQGTLEEAYEAHRADPCDFCAENPAPEQP